MPRKSNSKSAKAAKAKPADPTDEQADEQAKQNDADLAAALQNGGSNPEPASDEAKAAALEEQGKDQGGAKIVSNLEENDQLREAAREQSEERRASVDGDNLQPSATFAENEPAEGAIDRDEVELDVPRPGIFSSQDMTNSKAATPTQQKLAGMRAPQHRPPSATERKLAQQGIIPPYRD